MLGHAPLSVLPLSTLPTSGPVVVVPLSWAPGYPGTAPQREAYRTLQNPAMFAVFVISAPVFPDLSWGPRYPNSAPLVNSQARQQFLAFVNALPNYAVPTQTVTYPDRGAAWNPQARQQFIAHVNALPNYIVASIGGWEPGFPDRGARPDLRPPTGMVAFVIPLGTFAPPVLSWSPVLPQPKLGKVLVQATQPAFVAVVVTTPATPSKIIFVSSSYGTLVIIGSIQSVN